MYVCMFCVCMYLSIYVLVPIYYLLLIFCLHLQITELFKMISLLLSSRYEKDELMILKYDQDSNILSNLRIAYKITS